MRARVTVAWLALLALPAACADRPAPPVVAASEVGATPSASPTAEEDEARLVELRATDQFDEFAEHERAAKADGARLAWENFAPIVDGERVEWTNKAELWDSIAPKIRDEALLLGPEYRKPLWNTRNAIPNGVSMAWSDATTGGRGEYAEFGVTFLTPKGPAESYWGVLITTEADGRGSLSRWGSLGSFLEGDYDDVADRQGVLEDVAWRWVLEEEPDAA